MISSAEIIHSLKVCTCGKVCKDCSYYGTYYCCDKLNEDIINILKQQKENKENLLKEFARRLKETEFKQGNDMVIYSQNIDTILKEMLERQI